MWGLLPVWVCLAWMREQLCLAGCGVDGGVWAWKAGMDCGQDPELETDLILQHGTLGSEFEDFSLRSPGEGNGNPLQYSCLENLSKNRGALWATVPEVAKSWMRLRNQVQRVAGKGLTLLHTFWVVCPTLSIL